MFARRCRTAISLIALSLAIACGEPPQKELDQAEAAVAAARADKANVYAPDELAGAETTMKRAQEAVAQRDYRQALAYALDALEQAQGASVSAAKARADAKSEADDLLKAAEAEADAAQQKLAAADTGRQRDPRLQEPKLLLAKMPMLLQEARAAAEREDFAQAKASVAAMREQIVRAVALQRQRDAARKEGAERLSG